MPDRVFLEVDPATGRIVYQPTHELYAPDETLLIGLVGDRIGAVLWEGHEFTSHVALTRRNPSGQPLTWPNPPRLWFANNTSMAFALSPDSLTAFASQTLSAAQVDAIIAVGDTRIALKDSVTGEPFATGNWSLRTAVGPGGVGLVPGSGQAGYTVVNDVLVVSGQSDTGGGGDATDWAAGIAALDGV